MRWKADFGLVWCLYRENEDTVFRIGDKLVFQELDLNLSMARINTWIRYPSFASVYSSLKFYVINMVHEIAFCFHTRVTFDPIHRSRCGIVELIGLLMVCLSLWFWYYSTKCCVISQQESKWCGVFILIRICCCFVCDWVELCA